MNYRYSNSVVCTVDEYIGRHSDETIEGLSNIGWSGNQPAYDRTSVLQNLYRNSSEIKWLVQLPVPVYLSLWRTIPRWAPYHLQQNQSR